MLDTYDKLWTTHKYLSIGAAKIIYETMAKQLGEDFLISSVPSSLTTGPQMPLKPKKSTASPHTVPSKPGAAQAPPSIPSKPSSTASPPSILSKPSVPPAITPAPTTSAQTPAIATTMENKFEVSTK